MSTNPPQFGTAEYKSTTSGDVCKACKQTISGEYYRVNGIQACAACVDKVKAQMPKDSHSAFVRGILFGIGGAIAGLIVYSLFGIITGIVIGYVSLAVGWLVGKAIKAGSKGMGGRRYQVVAIALTYAAVSLSAIPMGIAQIVKQKKNEVKTSEMKTVPNSGAVVVDGGDASDNASEGAKSESGGAPQKKMSAGAVIGALLFAGLASPFLELGDEPGGIIGLVILFVGMNIAWKLTAGTKVDIVGPFKASEAAGAPPA
jgi:predicted lipid-binding transport protein (Tim44 family)